MTCADTANKHPDTTGMTVGSAYCHRCHSSIYEKWSDNPDKKPCESCHGNGASHALKPNLSNIFKPVNPGFKHEGTGGALKRQRKKTLVELFVMTHCPYGIDAEETIIPIITKHRNEIDFKIFYIAHSRDNRTKSTNLNRIKSGGKCETDNSDALTDGTDRFTSLHGLQEVLEGIRQTVIQETAPDYFLTYLKARNRNLNGEWKKAAAAASFSPEKISEISAQSDSKQGDSLFLANITEAEKRGISGSPTLYINGREWPEAISSYAIERIICNGAGITSKECEDFPVCGNDLDCRKPGFDGKCVNGGTNHAACKYTKAPEVQVTILNDDTCQYCHTGNIVRELMKRLASVKFENININSITGKEIIQRHKITAYPAFIFSKEIEKSSIFKTIEGTLIKSSSVYILSNDVVKSYFFHGRKPIPSKLLISGSLESPPFVETIRSLSPLLQDTLKNIDIQILPLAPEFTENDTTAIDAARTVLIHKNYDAKVFFSYLRCRGNIVQERFETHKQTKPDDWETCADSAGINKNNLAANLSKSL
ncbi:MAG: hypothetical protein JNL74_20565, partial [Fibrobacteres bacterium]|nr:hypothetical protein [Fibrobacterota bacterium]